MVENQLLLIVRFFFLLIILIAFKSLFNLYMWNKNMIERLIQKYILYLLEKKSDRRKTINFWTFKFKHDLYLNLFFWGVGVGLGGGVMTFTWTIYPLLFFKNLKIEFLKFFIWCTNFWIMYIILNINFFIAIILYLIG